MTDISNFRIDVQAEEDGVWRELGIGDIRVRLRSPHSATYRRVRNKLEAPYRSDIRKNKISDEQLIEIARKSVVMGALVDWENVTLSGRVIMHSEEMALRIFSKEYRDLLNALLKVFAEVEEIAAEERLENEKNLEDGCDTQSNGARKTAA